MLFAHAPRMENKSSWWLPLALATLCASGPASAQRLERRGQTVKFSGLVAVTASTPSGRDAGGNGKARLSQGSLQRTQDGVVLRLQTKRDGLAGYVPFLRWDTVELKGKVLEDSPSFTRVAFGDSNANNLQLSKQMGKDTPVLSSNGELVISHGWTRPKTLELKQNVRLSVPSYGSVSVHVRHLGDDMIVQ
jgi:hypothetical protein